LRLSGARKGVRCSREFGDRRLALERGDDEPVIGLCISDSSLSVTHFLATRDYTAGG
jgi:hypothetical protein